MYNALICSQHRFFFSTEDNIVFGVNLLTAVQRSRIAADGIELPTIFRECIDFLEENGIILYLYHHTHLAVIYFKILCIYCSLDYICLRVRDSPVV